MINQSISLWMVFMNNYHPSPAATQSKEWSQVLVVVSGAGVVVGCSEGQCIGSRQGLEPQSTLI